MTLPLSYLAPRWPREVRNYMMPMEQSHLLTMLDSIRPKRMIELGVNEGLTAKAVLQWIGSIEYYLGVDVPYGTVMPLSGQQPEVPVEAGVHAKHDSRFEVIIRQTGFENSIIRSKAPFDVAFIDGDHSYQGVSNDYMLAREIVPPGGWLFFHDYNNSTVEVTRFLDELHQGGMNLMNISGTMLAYTQL